LKKSYDDLVSGINAIEGDCEDQIGMIETKFKERENQSQSKYIEKINKFKAEYDGEIETLDVGLKEDTDNLIGEFDNLRAGIKSRIESYEKSIPVSEFTDEECHTILNNIKHHVENLKKLKGETNPYTEQVDKAQKDIIEPDHTTLDDMRKKENHYKLLIKLLTDNKSFVRKNLLDMYTPFINNKIEYYIEKVQLPHRIMINNDLTVDIEYMKNSISYGNMSMGEKIRTNFAVSMSFRDLMSVSGHQFNFLGIDELLDSGLDGSGFAHISFLLKDRDETVFIISHRDDLVTEVDEVFTVVKENGFSRIE
jgi:hypothetical protein